jgi:hypothetical protein
LFKIPEWWVGLRLAGRQSVSYHLVNWLRNLAKDRQAANGMVGRHFSAACARLLSSIGTRDGSSSVTILEVRIAE